MRDPERIDRILSTVRDVWEKYPDLRLGQMLGNIADDEVDLYYVEDDEIEERLKALYLNDGGDDHE